MKMSKGLKEDGIEVGNVYDKYASQNAIVKWIMKGFTSSLSGFVSKVNPKTIHEVGCGEGYWVLAWNHQNIEARGSDFSDQVINMAKDNAQSNQISKDIFSTKSIYDLVGSEDSADLIVCCEVLEHLENPEDALLALQRAAEDYVIISVPREPIWHFLNLARGKYIKSLGNTPGHIQHWSSNGIVNLVSQYFDVIEVKKPLPWTMLLCRKKR